MSLQSDLARFARLASDRQDKVVKGSFIQLGNEMEFKSPVDTGEFKSSWIGAFGSVDNNTFNPGRDAVSGLVAMLQGFNAGDVFYYTNSTPQAIPLEYGLSEQAPTGMVRLTARRWNMIVSAQIRAVQ